MVVKDPAVITNMKAQATLLVRGNYSNPPANGARIVAHVLSDPQLYAEWYADWGFKVKLPYLTQLLQEGVH